MPEDVILEVSNLSKKFTRSLKRSMFYGSADLLKSAFGIAPKSELLRNGEFWSLKDISFQVKKGEALGIIGQNGSGKTTLLRIINGIFPPDTGKIAYRGRLGALIAVGAGFHPHLTGRENIYLNGAVLGMGKAEIDSKMKMIIDFADIGEFLDAPIATYSSGMSVRLGFAIAIHATPDILLADEGLAVGDLAFGLKCYRKISEYRRNGGTVVLVSHSVTLVRNTCQKVLWLDKGNAVAYGNTQEVCDQYESFMMSKDSETDTDLGNVINNDTLTHVTNVQILNSKQEDVQELTYGEAFKIRIHYKADRVVKNPTFSITILNPESQVPICHFTVLDKIELPDISGVGYIDFIVDEMRLRASEYKVTVTFTENNDINNILDWHDKRYRFKVNAGGVVTYGMYNPKPKWELHNA